MGGPSSEYEISINSGKEVVKNLDPKKYNVLTVVIDKDRWLPISKEKLLSTKNPLAKTKSLQKNNSTDISTVENAFKNKTVDACFLALHGNFGEDGKIQAVLEFLKIPYTGSGILASALGMDKNRSRQIFTHAGLLTQKLSSLKKKKTTPNS